MRQQIIGCACDPSADVRRSSVR
ncbi:MULTISPECIES: hypothetical protein [Micromonospora]